MFNVDSHSARAPHLYIGYGSITILSVMFLLGLVFVMLEGRVG